MTNNKLIQALLAERDGYVRRNLLERIEAVDEALAALGYGTTETAAVQPESERATNPKSRKRRK